MVLIGHVREKYSLPKDEVQVCYSRCDQNTQRTTKTPEGSHRREAMVCPSNRCYTPRLFSSPYLWIRERCTLVYPPWPSQQDMLVIGLNKFTPNSKLSFWFWYLRCRDTLQGINVPSILDLKKSWDRHVSGPNPNLLIQVFGRTC